MNIDEQIEILQAAKRGEEIQTRPKHVGKSYGWYDALEVVQDQAFNFSSYDYRVKPKDRVLYVNYTKNYGTTFLGSMKQYQNAYANIKLTVNSEGELIRVELI